jgi:DNA-binding transcriptional ArsR family regulator
LPNECNRLLRLQSARFDIHMLLQVGAKHQIIATCCAIGRNSQWISPEPQEVEMNAAKSPARVGRPIDPSKRQRILDALTGDPSMFFEIGTPPYSVSDISERLGMDPSNLRKALLQMEKERLVIRERRKTSVWNAIAGGHMARTCLCFWNVATQDRDRRERDSWNARARDRSRAAFEKMFDR